MKAKTIAILLSSLFLLPCFAFGLMPPDDMEKRNLEAKLILVGEVKGTGKVLLPEKDQRRSPLKGVFMIEVLYVIKGYGTVKTGDQVHIIFRLPPKPEGGVIAHVSGSKQVRVKAGDLVVVYIDPTKDPLFYRPLAEGSSVAVIAPTSPPRAESEEKPGAKQEESK